jgi:hypothetical protein
VHLHPHLITVHLLEVLRVVDTEVPHPGRVALVVEEEAVPKMIPIFHVHLTRDRDHQDLGAEGGGGRTLIRDRLQGDTAKKERRATTEKSTKEETEKPELQLVQQL